MIKKIYDINSLDKLSSVALELLSLSDNRIFALYGEIGVGKTTLVKYMCHHLKVFDSYLKTFHHSRVEAISARFFFRDTGWLKT